MENTLRFKVNATLIRKAHPLRKRELTDYIVMHPMAKAIGAIVSSTSNFKFPKHKVFIGEKSVTVEDTYELFINADDSENPNDIISKFLAKTSKHFDRLDVRPDSIMWVAK